MQPTSDRTSTGHAPLRRWGAPVRRPLACVVLSALTGAAALAAGDAAPWPASESSAPAGPGFTISDCGNCHLIDPGFSHPVDVVPSMAVPPHLPLAGGRITCTTCHEEGSARHRSARIQHGALLRSPATTPALCAECHDRWSDSRRDMHASMLGQAHLRWLDRPGTEITDDRRSSGSRDPQSSACLGCHDGTVATDAGDHTDDAVRNQAGAPGANHPVGVLYVVDGSQPDEGPALRPPEMLDPRIRLYDLRVGCGSCHSPYAGGEALLVMSNRQSQLCLSCHNF
ncbi:MAG: cytochrome c3 family protein [Planctomycetota bacterium]